MTALTTSSRVDDILRRSAARTPTNTAVVFADRVWTYAGLDEAVTRAAARLLATGAVKGDRVAAYGRNSDAYLIGFLACARAGLVHVPINFALRGVELAYLLEQSGSTMALVDPSLRAAVDALRTETGVEQVLELRDAPGSLLEDASEGSVPELDVEVADTDLVQLLYTSGTTSRPKGAMMTHRALVHEYLSCLVGLDLDAGDNPLHAMPLYHSAQLHVFLMPWLAVGARNTLVEAPDPTDLLNRIEADGHGAFFAAPTLWVAMANHPSFGERDLSSLRKAYYGASVMPGPVLDRLRSALPDLGFYNCFGQLQKLPSGSHQVALADQRNPSKTRALGHSTPRRLQESRPSIWSGSGVRLQILPQKSTQHRHPRLHAHPSPLLKRVLPDARQGLLEMAAHDLCRM